MSSESCVLGAWIAQCAGVSRESYNPVRGLEPHDLQAYHEEISMLHKNRQTHFKQTTPCVSIELSSLACQPRVQPLMHNARHLSACT